ncbi:MAG: phosphate signaling complex protein PhoU [Eubacteriales bacterium]|jgi:phosphate transport system protein
MTPRATFENELQALHVTLIRMGALAEEAINHAILAFQQQNDTLAQEIIQGDRQIDEMEKRVEAMCLSLLLRQQPVARDLRVVSTALKLVTDIERIGDHASDIAELVLRMKGEHLYQVVQHIPHMAQEAQSMVHDAISAFVQGDVQAAREVMARDDQVDDLFNRVKQEVVEILKSSAENSDRCVDLLMIAKYLERIGDHAVNICEWVEFNSTGEYKNVRIM